MLRSPKHTKNPPSRAQIDQYLRLALASPDEDLLRRYFNECLGHGQKPEETLTTAERRWVHVNLEANPRWQESWRRLEEEVGHGVGMIDPESPVSTRLDYADVQSKGNSLLKLLRSIQPITLPQLAVAIFAVLIALYGLFWLASRAALPETYYLASLDAKEEELSQSVRRLNQRSLGEVPVVQNEFAQGAKALLEAPQHTLWLFPRYDHAQVDSAITHLERAFEATQESFQRAEIAFFLAKAYLMQENVPAARDALNNVLAQNAADYRDDAEELLRRLDTFD